MRHAGWGVTLTTPGEGAVCESARRRGLDIAHIPLGGIGRGQGARAVASWPVARKLARRHDVIYLSGGPSGRLIPALPRRRRVVLHVHDMVERVPPMWRRADVILVGTPAVAARLGPLAAKAHAIGYPVEPAPRRVTPPWPPGDGPVVGYVGRIEPRKGVLDLVRAAGRLKAEGVRVVLVGDDDFGADPAYAQQVRASTDVEHYPWTPGAAGLMESLDVLVLPSYAEPFGMVLAEAMTVGTPVVGTRVDGIPDLVQDGVNGRLVSPGAPDELAEAILDVLARREPMGAAGKEGAQRWNADAYAERVMKLIAP